MRLQQKFEGGCLFRSTLFIKILQVLILIASLLQLGYGDISSGTLDTEARAGPYLGENMDKIPGTTGKYVSKLSPCAGPYNDCCGPDPAQAQNPGVTFVYPSYLAQYFYVCVRKNNRLELVMFRCPFKVDAEGYHEGLFNADDQVGCYMSPPEPMGVQTQNDMDSET